MDWAKETEKEVWIEAILSLGKMHKKYMLYALESSLREMREL